MVRVRELRKMSSEELEAMNIDLGNQVDAFAADTKKQRVKINDELSRRARVERGEESDDVPVADEA